MAKLNLNKLFDEIRGKLGNLVFRRRPDGTLIVSSKPRYRKKGGSPAQKAHRQHVKEIAPFASHLARTHPIYAELAAADVARGKWMSPYNFALADCLKPPVIQRVDRAEGLIRVEATDNIGVTQVTVFIRDEAGKTLEAGDATRADGNWWEFASPTEGAEIVVKAFDLPGNCTKFVL